jgi:hypothetical protein
MTSPMETEKSAGKKPPRRSNVPLPEMVTFRNNSSTWVDNIDTLDASQLPPRKIGASVLDILRDDLICTVYEAPSRTLSDINWTEDEATDLDIVSGPLTSTVSAGRLERKAKTLNSFGGLAMVFIDIEIPLKPKN